MDYRTISESIKGVVIQQMLIGNDSRTLSDARLLEDVQNFLSADVLYIGLRSQFVQLDPVYTDGCSFWLVEDSNPSAATFIQGQANIGILPQGTSPGLICAQAKQTLAMAARLNEAVSRLARAMLEDKGLAYLTDVASSIFNMSILISDNSYRYLAWSRVEGDDDLIEWDEHDDYIADEFVREIQNRRIDEKIRSAGRPLLVTSGRGQRYLVMSASIGNLEVAHVSLFPQDREVGPFEQDLLVLFSQMVANDIQKYSLVNASNIAAYANLVTDVIDGKVASDTETRRRLSVFGFHLQRFVRVMVIEAKTDQRSDTRLQMMLVQIEKNIPDSLPVLFKGSLVVLLGSGSQPGDEDLANQQILRFLDNFQLVAGISSAFDDLKQAPQHFSQASNAIEIGHRHIPLARLYNYDSLRIHHLSSLCLDKNQLLSIHHPAIRLLDEYDRLHHSDLLNTLRIYLKFVRNPTRSAKALSIHKNTLFFRIDKIKKITGLDLGDGDEIMQLSLTFKLMEINA